MIHSIYKTLPFITLMACSVNTDQKPIVNNESKELSEQSKSKSLVDISPENYISFYNTFPKIELPFTIDENSIDENNNKRFCNSKYLETIDQSKFIDANQLTYLSDAAPINKEHKQFNVWCADHINHLDNVANIAIPGNRFYSNSNTLLTLYTFSKEQKHNDGFWEVWLVKMSIDNKIVDFKKLGVMGYSTFVDEGIEEQAKYSIKNVDYEYFTAEFTSNQCNMTLRRWSTSEGYDWRVDQNLKVNETIKQEDVSIVYEY